MHLILCYMLDFGTKLMFYIIIKLNESFVKLTTTQHFHCGGPDLIFGELISCMLCTMAKKNFFNVFK